MTQYWFNWKLLKRYIQHIESRLFHIPEHLCTMHCVSSTAIVSMCVSVYCFSFSLITFDHSWECVNILSFRNTAETRTQIYKRFTKCNTMNYNYAWAIKLLPILPMRLRIVPPCRTDTTLHNNISMACNHMPIFMFNIWMWESVVVISKITVFTTTTKADRNKNNKKTVDWRTRTFH